MKSNDKSFWRNQFRIHCNANTWLTRGRQWRGRTRQAAPKVGVVLSRAEKWQQPLHPQSPKLLVAVLLSLPLQPDCTSRKLKRRGDPYGLLKTVYGWVAPQESRWDPETGDDSSTCSQLENERQKNSCSDQTLWIPVNIPVRCNGRKKNYQTLMDNENENTTYLFIFYTFHKFKKLKFILWWS